MKKLRIAFFGNPQIACPALEALTKINDVEVTHVCTFPDKPVGRKQVMTPTAVKKTAESLELNVIEISNKSELTNFVSSAGFDLGVVIAFGVIFPEAVFQEKPFVNVHFSSLPKHRGASPVQSAILNGQDTCGITFQHMVTQLDAGNILLQKEFNIRDMKTSEVWNDFAHKTADMMPDFVTGWVDQTLDEKPQIEGQATFCSKFEKQDGLVNPKVMSATEIYNKYRAFDVFPGVFLQTEKGILKLKKLSPNEMSGSVELKCKEESLFLEEVQLEGKPSTNAADFIRGNPGVF